MNSSLGNYRRYRVESADHTVINGKLEATEYTIYRREGGWDVGAQQEMFASWGFLKGKVSHACEEFLEAR